MERAIVPTPDERTLFDAARQMEPGEARRAYIEGACGGDAKLRQRVEALLRVHEEHGTFLQAPLIEAAFPPEIGEGPGAQIGPYKLLEQIGEGGMGLVFVAEQTQPVFRRVALKVIKPGMDSRQVIARFEAERQALALMDHPHIAHVFDGGSTQSGRPYFVMELVRGSPITQFCDDNRLPLQERLELFHCVCQAVQHAHHKGIIHRDIKPSNVMVTSHDGTPVVKVIDFGVAKAIGQKLTDKTVYTHFAQFVGTPTYLSPEQAGLSSIDVDTRTDIYALGVLLYELLTGSTPFTQERLQQAAFDEMRRIIREEEPPRPSTRISTTVGRAASTISDRRQSDPRRLRQACYGELDWIVMKALEKDRQRRYETASAFAADVQRYLNHEPVQAHPPSLNYRLRKFVRRHRAGVLAAVLVGLALVAGLVGMTWGLIHATQAEAVAVQEAKKKEAALAAARKSQHETLRAERMARLREAAALVGQAHGTRLSRRPGQRFEALAALGKAAAIGRELGQPPEWFEPLQSEAIAALALPDIHITQEFDGFPPGTIRVELSDDFELYVRSTAKGRCTIHRVADNVEIARLPEPGERTEACFGSGRILAVCGSSRHFQLWDLTGPEPACRVQEQGVTGLWGCHFRADGRLLAISHMNGAISVYDVASGQRVYRLAPQDIFDGVNLHLALHPSEPLVACFSYFHHPVLIRDLRTGAVVASANPPWDGGNGDGAWSPAGRTLLVPCGNSGAIQQYEFDPAAPALRPQRLIHGPENGGTMLSYHPAGDRFVSRGWDGVVHLFDAVSGQCLFSAPSLPKAASEGLRFDRTGQRLAAARVGTQQERVGLWFVADAREYRAFVHSGPGLTGLKPAVHPEGRLAAVGQADGMVLFDLETGSLVTPFPALKGTTQVAFDGAGNLLTNSSMGFYRWPVRPDSTKSGRLLVGPPQRLPFNRDNGQISVSRDGRVIAQGAWVGEFAGGWILHLSARAPRRVRASNKTGPCSVSPDGRWVAFGPIVNVFDAATGQEVWRSAAQAEANYCRFSPDGRWLATNGEGGRVYAAGTWEPGPHLGPGIPWDISPDSALAIMGQTNGIYRLVELASGRELVRLEDPEQNTGAAAFTPDGTKLVVSAKNGLRVWDLRRIRQQLAKPGLDWKAPPYPPATEKKNLAPLEVKVDLGALLLLAELPRVLAQAGEYIGLNQWDKAAAEYAKADLWARPLRDNAFEYACLFLIRGDSDGYNRFCQAMIRSAADTKEAFEPYVLARSCAMARKSPVDPARVVQWANQAIARDRSPWCFHVLGLAQYRAGQFDQALQSLTSAHVKTWLHWELNWFGLALVHHRLGHPDEARLCLDKGIQWLEREGSPGPERPARLLPPDRLEAQLLRREAEETLKAKRSP